MEQLATALYTGRNTEWKEFQFSNVHAAFQVMLSHRTSHLLMLFETHRARSVEPFPQRSALQGSMGPGLAHDTVEAFNIY